MPRPSDRRRAGRFPPRFRATLVALLGLALPMGLAALGMTRLATAQSDTAPAPPEAAAPENLSAEAIAFAQARCVKVYGSGIGREHGYATGLLVSSDGLILTAQGIYLSGIQVRVVLPDGTVHQAKVERRSDAIQTALLKIDARTPEYFDVPAAVEARQGDWVLAVSNLYKVAEGVEPLSVNLGILSLRTKLEGKRGTQEVHYDGEVLLVDAITANPGACGGALVTLDGRLVGMIGKIIESTSTNTRLNYAVPADLLRKFLDGQMPAAAATQAVAPSLATTGHAPALGIRMFTAPGKRAPAYIDSVERGSSADKAGLKKDDLVLSIGGDIVRNIGDYQKIAAALPADKAIKLLIKRNRDVLVVTIEPAAEQHSNDARGNVKSTSPPLDANETDGDQPASEDRDD